MRILLIEDDEVDTMAVRRLLRKLPGEHEIYHARNGVEALELMRSGHITQPYIVLLDLMMPMMNGLEVLHEIRHDPALELLTVIVLSGSDDPRDMEIAEQEHVFAYAIKQRLIDSVPEFYKVLTDAWEHVRP